MKKKISKGLASAILLLLMLGCVIYCMGSFMRIDKMLRQEDLLDNVPKETPFPSQYPNGYAVLADSCEKMNQNFALDSLRVIKSITFTSRDTLVDCYAEFEDGGSGRSTSHVLNRPQLHVVPGDTVIHIRKYVVNFDPLVEVGSLSIFEEIAYSDEESQWCWL